MTFEQSGHGQLILVEDGYEEALANLLASLACYIDSSDYRERSPQSMRSGATPRSASVRGALRA
jgi:hypothetical protein